jgi:hypothetical protein
LTSGKGDEFAMKFSELEVTGEDAYVRCSKGLEDQTNNLKLVIMGQHGIFSGYE